MIRAVAASRVLWIRSGIRLAPRQDEINSAESGYAPVEYTKRAVKSTPDQLAIRRLLYRRVVKFGVIPRTSVELDDYGNRASRGVERADHSAQGRESFSS